MSTLVESGPQPSNFCPGNPVVHHVSLKENERLTKKIQRTRKQLTDESAPEKPRQQQHSGHDQSAKQTLRSQAVPAAALHHGIYAINLSSFQKPKTGGGTTTSKTAATSQGLATHPKSLTLPRCNTDPGGGDGAKLRYVVPTYGAKHPFPILHRHLDNQPISPMLSIIQQHNVPKETMMQGCRQHHRHHQHIQHDRQELNYPLSKVAKSWTLPAAASLSSSTARGAAHPCEDCWSQNLSRNMMIQQDRSLVPIGQKNIRNHFSAYCSDSDEESLDHNSTKQQHTWSSSSSRRPPRAIDCVQQSADSFEEELQRIRLWHQQRRRFDYYKYRKQLNKSMTMR